MRTSAVALVLRTTLVSGTFVLASTNRTYGGYSLPGGKVEPGEMLIRSALSRELLEETSLVVPPIDLVFVARGYNALRTSLGDVHFGEVHIFYAKAAIGEIRDVEPGTKNEWLRWSVLLQNSPMREFYLRHLPDGIEHFRPTVFTR